MYSISTAVARILYIGYRLHVNPFHATGLILYLLKTLENQRFCGGTGVTRNQSTPNLSKNEYFLPPDMHTFTLLPTICNPCKRFRRDVKEVKTAVAPSQLVSQLVHQN